MILRSFGIDAGVSEVKTVKRVEYIDGLMGIGIFWFLLGIRLLFLNNLSTEQSYHFTCLYSFL